MARTSKPIVDGPLSTMLHMLVGSWVSQALYVVAKLGIAELIHERARTCDDLAGATQADARALYRLLRALASLGVFSEDAAGRFHPTPLSDCLHSATPGSLHAFAIMLGEKEHWQAWGDALHSVKTGRPAFDHVFGAPHFQYFAKHPEAARFFNEGMSSRSAGENDAIVTAYDFSGFRTVVDVGGGQGTLLDAIIRATPATSAVLFDLPHVIAAPTATQDRRYRRRSGNFFTAVPRGADAYLLKKVIHDWDDERAIAILRNCRNAMSDEARLLLIEPIIPRGNTPSFNKLLDLLMLIWTSGGRERTADEHRKLLTVAGLEPLRTIETRCPLSIIEARPFK